MLREVFQVYYLKSSNYNQPLIISPYTIPDISPLWCDYPPGNRPALLRLGRRDFQEIFQMAVRVVKVNTRVASMPLELYQQLPNCTFSIFQNISHYLNKFFLCTLLDSCHMVDTICNINLDLWALEIISFDFLIFELFGNTFKALAVFVKSFYEFGLWTLVEN